jgi:hypothetical protein
VTIPLAERVVDRSFLDKGYRDVRFMKACRKRPMGEPDEIYSVAETQNSGSSNRGS